MKGRMMDGILTFLQIDRNFPVMVIRLIITMALSGIIGLEREARKQPAGLRTHILVGIGACAMMQLNEFGLAGYQGQPIDLARIPAYIVSGIGFLGAGTIIVRGNSIRGLTTAASIWVVAGLGMICGAGMFGLGIVVTFMVMFGLFVLHRIETRLKKKVNPATESEKAE